MVSFVRDVLVPPLFMIIIFSTFDFTRLKNISTRYHIHFQLKWSNLIRFAEYERYTVFGAEKKVCVCVCRFMNVCVCIGLCVCARIHVLSYTWCSCDVECIREKRKEKGEKVDLFMAAAGMWRLASSL